MMHRFVLLISILSIIWLESLAVTELSKVEGLFFSETFDETDPFVSGKWFKSSDSKYNQQSIKVTAANKPVPGFENDKGVQLTKDMRHYGFGTQFPEPLVMKGKDVFIQYELKIEEEHKCGGAYIKLPMKPSGEDVVDLTSFSNDTPYTIMFGPDRCGSSNKVHFIIQYQNPISLTWEEKHYNETIPTKMSDDSTHLYTLAIRKESTFDIFIDGVLINSGSLLTHMIPAINPIGEIDDPEDTKPTDWVDIAETFDTTVVKPDDWDENAPSRLPDPLAKKPAEWDEAAHSEIPDPSASKPEDWDDDEDGEWEAPSVPNPACDTGCGPWSPPMVYNSEYKGIWSPPRIPNADYKGPWAPQKIANPNFFLHESPLEHLPDIAGLVVEVWTTSGAILFDNFVISNSLDAMAEFTNLSYKLKAVAERTFKETSKKEQKKAERETMIVMGGFKEMVTGYVMEVVEYLTENPTVLAATIACIISAFLYLVLFGGKDVKVEMALAAAARVADAERMASTASSSASSGGATVPSE
jgi:calnexin